MQLHLQSIIVMFSVADLGFESGGSAVQNISTALMCTHEAGDACAQNDIKGVPRNPRNPPGSATGSGGGLFPKQ